MATGACVTTLCPSAAVSMARPIAQMTTPAMSRPVPNAGLALPSRAATAGELRMMTGSETVQTCAGGHKVGLIAVHARTQII